MRKAIYLGAALAAVMTTSCSNDMDQFGTTTGDGNVVIQLQLPDNLATRAFGDGTTATNLKYAVYHSGETNVVTQGTATFNGLQATVNLNLVNGKSYDFIFWADNYGNSFYTFDADNQTVTVDYDGLKGNDENRDAFFGQLTNQEITGPATLSTTLKRPFAQINLGTSDFDEVAVKAAYPVFSSSMTISTTLPTTLNLLDGNVSGATETVVTTSENRPDGETFPVNGYDYVSMNYILVDAAKDVIDLTFSFKNEGAEISNLSVASVPVQRNYRTNIYGAVFTSPTDVMITIEPAFNEPDFNSPKSVATPDEFASALADPKVKEIILTAPLNLTNVQASDMIISSPKVIDLSGVTVEDGEYAITLGQYTPFDITSSLTINGGNMTNGQGQKDVEYPLCMFHVNRNGVLNLNGVTIDGNTDHHFNEVPRGDNSAVIDYWGNAEINISDSRIKGGMYVLFGANASEEAKVTCTNSYFESTSSRLDNGQYWAYAINAKGEFLLKDCTVVGIAGAILANAYTPGSSTKVTIDGGNYYTYNSSKEDGGFNNDGGYAVFAESGATVTINGGHFYGANKQSDLAGENGTSAVVGGENGNIVINGGYFSGVPYNNATDQTYAPAEGFRFKSTEENVEGRKYILTVEKGND